MVDRERLARRIAKHSREHGLARSWRDYIDVVLADISAQGFAIVPVEPTQEMLEAVVDICIDNVSFKQMAEVYRRMLTASEDQPNAKG